MRDEVQIVNIESVVPEDHFLRKLEAALDLSFVYEETAEMYSRKYGRPPIDPVVLVKYVLVGFLYGIPSERQIEERIKDSMSMRWYLGLDLFDAVPDHSTISQLRRRKPKFRKVFRRLFEEVVKQCIEKGLVSGRLVATDSTHVKANASRASEVLVEIPESPGDYWERLDGYEREAEEELVRRGGKRVRRKKPPKKDGKRSHRRVSTTDPEAGHMKRPGKPRGQYYLSHQTVDTDHGIILDVRATAGDVHDNIPYLDQIEYIHKNIIPIQAAAADAAYDWSLGHRVMEDNGIDFYVVPQKHYDRTQVEFKKDQFQYAKEKDVYICPNGKELRPTHLHLSSGNLDWEYHARREDCRGCPHRSKCLTLKDKRGHRKLEDSYFKPSVERHFAKLQTMEYKEALLKRQIWCEGSFAAQKWGHNLTRLLRRGIEAAQDHCLLSATALNLKRMIRCME